MASTANAAQAAEGQRFRYDERVASAIIPALLVFAMMAEAPVIGMLVVRPPFTFSQGPAKSNAIAAYHVVQLGNDCSTMLLAC